MHRKSTRDIFNSKAKEYQDKFMDTSLYHESFDVFCDMTGSPNAQILDIGCGPGNIAKYLLAKRPDFRILGIDLAPNMIALAKANNPTAKFEVLDYRDISKINSERFDGIMCGFCLPYLSPRESQLLISDCAELLSPKGVMYISTMEEDAFNRSGIKKNSYGEEAYIHFYREEDLVKALEFGNFKVHNIQRRKYLRNGTEVTDIIIVSKRKL